MASIDSKIDAPLTLAAQIEARASLPELADRPFLLESDRAWSWSEFRDQSRRYAHFLIGRLGAPDSGEPGHVAMMMENRLELMGLYGGCGYSGHTLFGLNTGLRGDVLAGVLNQSRARLLVVDEAFVERIEKIRGGLELLSDENILVVDDSGSVGSGRSLVSCIESETGEGLGVPDVGLTPEQVQMVIYTSGTTGLPKGINNNHLKLMLIGKLVSRRLDLGIDDRGYACMPLFHSNAIFLGFQPALTAGASLFIRRRFSASEFARDVLRHGITYWNYVGEPVHYILGALERQYGGDPERIRNEIALHPDNRFAYALGNGAAPPDIDRFISWFGLEDMYELYGSTEAAISTFRTRTDPRGSVGEITDDRVKIVDPEGRECPAAELDDTEHLLNYDAAVGEICRVAPDTALFQGYFDNPEANDSKYREGVYHSGDLGHILVRDGRRFLYFDGRTEDWIRKDGENFSAAQVARGLQEHPDVALAVAYGAPCAISDEHVMAAIKLREGAQFDPAEFFSFCQDQIVHHGMDPKWFPDFVRIVEEFPYTETQKVLVRELRSDHFDRRKLTDAAIFWRTRQSTTYADFSAEDYETLRKTFVERERDQLL